MQMTVATGHIVTGFNIFPEIAEGFTDMGINHVIGTFPAIRIIGIVDGDVKTTFQVTGYASHDTCRKGF